MKKVFLIGLVLTGLWLYKTEISNECVTSITSLFEELPFSETFNVINWCERNEK